MENVNPNLILQISIPEGEALKTYERVIPDDLPSRGRVRIIKKNEDGQFLGKVLFHPAHSHKHSPSTRIMNADHIYNFACMRNETTEEITFVTGGSGAKHLRITDAVLDHDERKKIVYAGQVIFNAGEVVFWDNKSGHFRPQAEGATCLSKILPMDKFYSFTKQAELISEIMSTAGNSLGEALNIMPEKFPGLTRKQHASILNSYKGYAKVLS
jgi:hypothetical protein